MRKEKKGKGGGRGKRTAFAVIAAALVVGMAGGAALAYFTDTEYGINKFLIGHVEIEAWEPNFPTEDEDGDGVPDECELMIPYQTVTKDPRIKNTGDNDAVVFFKVTSPVETLTLIDDSGSRQEAALSDLFWFKQKGDSEDLHENNFNSNWIRLTDLDGEIVECEGVNDEGKGYTYIFGYHTRLAPGKTTETLFDYIQNKKYGSNTISANEKETVKIEAYAIQADEIVKSGIDIDTSGEITADDLSYIYQTFFNQNVDNLD